MVLLTLFFVLSIGFSFLCSIWEAVLLSITPSYVNRKLQEGGKLGVLIKKYKEDIDRPLSAILTLNTIAHTVGAIGVGVQAGALFGEHKISLGFIEITGESIIASVMTLAILILSEIIPKTIGANSWRRLAPFTISSLRILLIILSPFVWISQLITKLLKKDKERSVFSRADFAAMTRVSEESGAIDQSESKIIHNLLKLNKLTVRDIMTPRAVMLVAESQMTLSEFLQKHKPLPFSRIPIYTNEPDQIIGVVLKDELLFELAEDNHKKTLGEIKREVTFVPDSTPLPDMLDVFVTKKIHIAIVNDEYGSIAGLVTMEDLFETLLGLEIVDESDKVADLQRYARNQWEERAKRLGLIK